MDLQAELSVLHKELSNTRLEPYITQKQVQALASLMGQCIQGGQKKRKRLYMLNEIARDALFLVAGVREITSTKNLTGTMASVLIDLFLEDDIDWQPSEYAKRLIGALESKFEENNRTGEDKTITSGVVA